MTIRERVATVAVGAVLFVAVTGCISVGNGNGRSVTSSDGQTVPVKHIRISLYPDGHLDTGNMYIGPDQIETLAKEIAGSTVELTPVSGLSQSVTLEQALRTRDELLKHGVARVILPMGN